MSAPLTPWQQLTSAAGWHGFTATVPVELGPGCWRCILALIVGDEIHHWQLFRETAEELREEVVATVYEWMTGAQIAV